MRIVKSVSAMQRMALRWRREGARVGFVPTMGYLHEGHLSLVRAARHRVGKSGLVVLSIYVNPTQFAAHEDLSRYPRDLGRDARLCRAAGVDVVFLPDDGAMYPGRDAGAYSTYVVEERVAQRMEGAARPMHFRGVATVVAKLFNLVLPEVAVFGAKDFQQAAVIKRMTGDLNFPVEIIVAPTVREKDGLAMSSRNKYLTPAQRAQATVLWRAIGEARSRGGSDGVINPRQMKARLKQFIEAEPEARMDYVEFFDPVTLEPASRLRRGTQMALAVFIGKTRLIDNEVL
jgi:pantoate--beta-alanine ligase